MQHVGGQQGNAPCAALSRRLHDGDGRINGCSQDLLAHFLRLEQAAVSHQTVNLHAFFLQENVQTGFQRAQRGKQVHAHEVRQIEIAFRISHEERTSLFKAGDMLSGKIVVGQQAAAVRISLQSLAVQGAEQVVSVHLHAESLRKLLKEADPGVQIGGAVVAVYHGHRASVGRGHHVDLRMNLFQILFQNHHGEYAGSGGHVSGALRHAVGGRHSGSRISLRRADGNARLQVSAHIQKLRPFFRQRARIVSREQNLRQDIGKLPGIAFVRDQLFKGIDHGRVVLLRLRIDGKHARRLADAEHLSARQLPVYIARKGGQISDILHVLLPVQDGLIEMGDTPSLGNVEMKGFRQLHGRLFRDGVPPSPEGHQHLPVFVKWKITVHHGAEAKRADRGQGDAVFFLHVLRHVSVAVLQPGPDILLAVGPDIVFITVFPLVAAGGDRSVVLSGQNRLNPGGTEFNSQGCFPLQNRLPDIHNFHYLLHPGALRPETRAEAGGPGAAFFHDCLICNTRCSSGARSSVP